MPCLQKQKHAINHNYSLVLLTMAALENHETSKRSLNCSFAAPNMHRNSTVTFGGEHILTKE